jgi:hypothetical protein
VNGHHTPEELFAHYQVLRPALLRLQRENPPAFDLVVREITARLKIKGKTVLTDLASLRSPSAAKDAKELLEAIEQVQPLRLAQEFRGGVLWFGVMAGETKLLFNSQRVLLTLDKLPDGLRVKDQGFDLCRQQAEAQVDHEGTSKNALAAMVENLDTAAYRTRLAEVEAEIRNTYVADEQSEQT